MWFLYLVEVMLVVVFLAISVSQLLVPLLRGTKVFPFFRKERKLINELESVQQEIREALINNEVEEKIDDLKKQKQYRTMRRRRNRNKSKVRQDDV